MRILFVGHNWRGSSARSLREALQRRPDVDVAEVAEDQFIPRYSTVPLRIANRVLGRWQRAELEQEIRRKAGLLDPDALIVYKGSGISPSLVEECSKNGILTVNVFPDYSPHAYGPRLKETIGKYDLVVTTKPFHPELWASIYGYTNTCVFVPHGYDEGLHHWPKQAGDHEYDVVMAASWRPEYEELMRALAAELHQDRVSVAVAGSRWRERWKDRPAAWDFFDGLYGRAYGAFVRRGRIVIAPLHRRVVVDGQGQPGDVDTIRTYELAAAYTFFVHQRTDYVQTVYDEKTEVPMWGSPSELADLIRFYLDHNEKRRRMADAAHARAVPAYSLHARADEIVRYLKVELDARRA